MLSSKFKQLQDFFKTLDIEEAIENGDLAQSFDTIKALKSLEILEV